MREQHGDHKYEKALSTQPLDIFKKTSAAAVIKTEQDRK